MIAPPYSRTKILFTKPASGEPLAQSNKVPGLRRCQGGVAARYYNCEGNTVRPYFVSLRKLSGVVCSRSRFDPETHVYLGARATEAEIKRLSREEMLAQYQIVHFATHGAIAGELSASPGLILTPPDKASELNDGFLSASEIAALKLDADWVILSAYRGWRCQGADALSGLARAFFTPALAREVASESTVKLITKIATELKGDPQIGRAEALPRSMLDLITEGKTHEAHPAFWAPFVLVGEGAVAQ